MKVLLSSIFMAMAVLAQDPLPIDSATEQGSQTATTSNSNQSLVETANPKNRIPVSDSIKIPVLDFKNTEIRDILRGVGMQYGVNIYVEPDVTGTVSLYLTDITVKNAIDFIVKRNQCLYTVENGIVKVSKYQQPPPPLPPEPLVTFRNSDGLLDIDLKEIPIQSVARYFSDSAGVNVVVEGNVEKTITVRLVKIRPEKAVKAIFESNGLGVNLSDGIYYISNNNWNGGTGTGQDASQWRQQRLSITVKDAVVSVEIDNASLDQVVRSIAIQSGINIIIYDVLTGQISAKFQNVSLDNSLRFLLQNTKFTFWKENDVFFIGSREMNQQKTTVIIPLKHIMADETQITKSLPPNISSNAVVKYNSEHNSVIVIGSFDVVAQAQEFIEKIDTPIPQVLIEALVVDFNINKIRDYGLSLFTQGVNDTGGAWFNENFLPTLQLKPGREKTIRVLSSVLEQIGVDQIIELPKNFRANVHALEGADIVKVHSTPQIATINGNAASITIGETRYYKLTKQTTAPVNNDATVIGTDERFEVIKFNTQLEVTPWVMDEGYVMVKIRPEFNIPRTGGDGSTPPNVDTRVIESMVRLRDGQTIVLGGQRQTEDMVSRRGVPFLSSIPILGWLFSSRTTTKVETQMMIFLTPHVYYGDDNAVKPDDYFGKEINHIIKKYGINQKKESEPEEKKAKVKIKKIKPVKIKKVKPPKKSAEPAQKNEQYDSVQPLDSVPSNTELPQEPTNEQ